MIGERQRGLVTYVMSLMNGARIGIAGQSMGIAEAAYRIARDYAASREQFGVPIEKLPAVRESGDRDEDRSSRPAVRCSMRPAGSWTSRSV